MRKTLLMTTGLAWLALTGAASAVTVSLKPGPMDPQYFASEAAGANGFTIDGITWSLVSGSAATAKGTTPGISAAPLGMGTSTTTGTTYMAVEGGGTEMATWAKPQTSLSIYWGSIDGDVAGTPSGGNTNDLSITVDGFTLTGEDLIALGAHGTGLQTDPKANQLITIAGLGDFTEVEFHTTRNAFEFSLGSSSSVPEPATWAMMMLGFAGLGYAAFRRNAKGQMTVSAI
jgi:PEP-CTERM motif